MKVSVSLSPEDVAFLDAETAAGLHPSRSAALSAAVEFYRNRGLMADYAAAYEEWQASGDAAAWDATVGDGIS